ncbi:hypothetical protein [uncultured Psychroserpens sp.]|uniref:hypothetical protein n=1 Tax=uncultured Psychroserpens sp. TaxID=255436 RepID=UPI002619C09D|nr:hypothetical protein [uncultured Psychroserpens sp.]
MKIVTLPKYNITLVFMLVAILCYVLVKQCSNTPITTQELPKVTIVRDTVWQTKIDTFRIQTLQYKTVYVNKDEVQTVFEDRTKIKDSSALIEAKAYKDTLRSDDIDIFSYALVEGNLLDSKISYQLKVPREITEIKTIEYPKTYRGGVYLFSEVGGNANQFDNLSLGLQYNRKGKWFVSYRINHDPINQVTHNIGVGVRLFN